MFNNPYGGYGGYPQQPIVFIPSPGMPPTGGPPDLNTVTSWISQLEGLKKALKEEKKDDKPKKDAPGGGVILTAMFMLLVSPITGPAVFYFFKLSGMMH
jgi:hypothetical protein